jgi:integration host factor subunit beta
MTTVTKKELIDRIAKDTQAKRVTVKRIIQTFLDTMTAELMKGNRLEFRDFGVFETRNRASRVAQNPKTLQRVDVPAKRTVKFKMGRLMKERMVSGSREPARPAGGSAGTK